MPLRSRARNYSTSSEDIIVIRESDLAAPLQNYDPPRPRSNDYRGQGDFHNNFNREHRHNERAKCTPILLAIILCILFLGLLTLGLETYATYKDNQWNKVVKGIRSFPYFDEAHKFFSGKTLNMRRNRDENLKVLILRDSSIAIAFSILMVIAIFISIVHLFLLYGFGCISEASKITSGVYVVVGVFYLVCGSLVVALLTDVYEKNYRVGSHLLFHSVLSSKHGKAEKLLELRLEEETLGYILTLCAYVSKLRTDVLWDTPSKLEDHGNRRPRIHISTRSIHVYSIRDEFTEEYSLGDLDYLGFCDNSDIRTAVYSLLFISVLLCWTIPMLNFMRGRCDESCLPEETPSHRPSRTHRTVLLLATGSGEESQEFIPSTRSSVYHLQSPSSVSNNFSYTPNYPPGTHFS